MCKSDGHKSHDSNDIIPPLGSSGFIIHYKNERVRKYSLTLIIVMLRCTYYHSPPPLPPSNPHSSCNSNMYSLSPQSHSILNKSPPPPRHTNKASKTKLPSYVLYLTVATLYDSSPLSPFSPPNVSPPFTLNFITYKKKLKRYNLFI